MFTKGQKSIENLYTKTQETTCNHIDQIFMKQYKSSLLIPHHGFFFK